MFQLQQMEVWLCVCISYKGKCAKSPWLNRDAALVISLHYARRLWLPFVQGACPKMTVRYFKFYLIQFIPCALPHVWDSGQGG